VDISQISEVQLAGSVTKATVNRPFICPILSLASLILESLLEKQDKITAVPQY
jgi:hypothetical protein